MHPSLRLLFCVMSLLCSAVATTALWRVVEAHKTLAAQEGRLDLLLQQLADKEALLEQARQLVSAGQWWECCKSVLLLKSSAQALSQSWQQHRKMHEMTAGCQRVWRALTGHKADCSNAGVFPKKTILCSNACAPAATRPGPAAAPDHHCSRPCPAERQAGGGGAADRQL